eukprot:scaffold147439_cov31-Tisochrysis_lutea.AAC.2
MSNLLNRQPRRVVARAHEHDSLDRQGTYVVRACIASAVPCNHFERLDIFSGAQVTCHLALELSNLLPASCCKASRSQFDIRRFETPRCGLS